MSNDHRPVAKPQEGESASPTEQPLMPLMRLEAAIGSADATPGLTARKLIVTGRGPLSRGDEDEELCPRPSFRSVLRPQDAIGDDDRAPVLDPDTYPWRMICHLRLRFPTGPRGGTGWLVGPRTVITAGHCIYNRDFGGWAILIRVSPGREGSTTHFGDLTATGFETVQRWLSDQHPDFDYGVIHLPDPIGDRTGWFGASVLDDASVQGLRVNISGYPTDKQFGTQWFHANRISGTKPRRLFYEVDTKEGQSGSPVWIVDQDGQPQVVAIHTCGVECSTDPGVIANSGVRITSEVFENIKAWKQADEI